MSNSKVFCIGLFKTGTMSMGRALIYLGYKLCPANPARAKVNQLPPNSSTSEIFRTVTEEAHKYTAFRNQPWVRIYKECATAFPDSKFILTQRNREAWLNSVRNHQISKNRTPQDDDYYINVYNKHTQEVKSFFSAQPSRLLVIDLENIEWDPVCNFLGKTKPLFRAFPHRNKTAYRNKNHIEKVLSYEFGEIIKGLRKSIKT